MSEGQSAKGNQTSSLFALSSWPELSYALFQKIKWNVIGLSSRAPQLFNHAHRAVGIKAVHHDRRCSLEFRPRRQKRRDGITGPLIVRSFRAVMLRHQIVIEKNRVIIS